MGVVAPLPLPRPRIVICGVPRPRPLTGCPAVLGDVPSGVIEPGFFTIFLFEVSAASLAFNKRVFSSRAASADFFGADSITLGTFGLGISMVGLSVFFRVESTEGTKTIDSFGVVSIALTVLDSIGAGKELFGKDNIFVGSDGEVSFVDEVCVFSVVSTGLAAGIGCR